MPNYFRIKIKMKIPRPCVNAERPSNIPSAPSKPAGRHSLSDEAPQERPHRDGAARARLQSHACDEHPGPGATHPGHAGVRRPVAPATEPTIRKTAPKTLYPPSLGLSGPKSWNRYSKGEIPAIPSQRSTRQNVFTQPRPVAAIVAVF